MRYNDSRQTHFFISHSQRQPSPSSASSASQPLQRSDRQCRAGGLPWINQDATSVSSGHQRGMERHLGVVSCGPGREPDHGLSGRLALQVQFQSTHPEPTDWCAGEYEFSDPVPLDRLSAGGSHSNINSGTIGFDGSKIPAGEYWVLILLLNQI